MVTKTEKAIEKTEEVKEAKADPRRAAYDALLAKYEMANPVKFALKKAKGDFKDIPASFK